MKTRQARYRCKSCGNIYNDDQRLTGPNPFKENDEVFGCPNCKACNDHEYLCDVDGCENLFVTGWVSRVDRDHRFTCRKHAPLGDLFHES